MGETKRRRILVDKKFQFHYLKIWLLTGLGLVVISVGFFFLARGLLGSFENPIMTRLIIGVSVFIILFSLLMGLLSVAMTHHVAGAAYRLQLGLDKLLDGDFTDEIHLRKGDYLQGLASGLNALKDQLRMRSDQARELVERLESLRQRVDGSLGEDDKSAIDEICTRIRAMAGRPSTG